MTKENRYNKIMNQLNYKPIGSVLLRLYGVVKRLKIIIKLFFVYIKWCFNDFVENYQDIKFRYRIETNKELLQIQKELDNL